ncbi:hypothetical protein C2G38_2155831 [Gigaspora rosea]|uniref:Uncharacterized protein n=1 Tax=Gigaspora rosea TaxID=44941 RepID=A0A397W5G2_9GLOM|nr:hypothetical protein C2G38_2155831 [Gigaspora rosea]
MGVAQSIDISSNPRDWSHNDVSTLKATLKKLFTSHSVILKFLILTISIMYSRTNENLWKNIIIRSIYSNQPTNSIILPPRMVLTPIMSPQAVESFSTILSYDHLAEIALWIDKKLLHTLWKISHMILNYFAEIKGTDGTLGGYDPIAWDKPEKNYKYCNERFIFSLKNINIQTFILSRVKRHNMQFISREL